MKLSLSLPSVSAMSVFVLCGTVAALLLSPPVSSAESVNYEINRLISSVGRNGWTFIRNGVKYRGKAAREHLRSKKERNEQLIATTEEFIEKIASGSAATGTPYLIQCRGQEETTANEWFTVLLEKSRLPSQRNDDET